MDPKDDEFGPERLAASILKNRHKPAQEMVDSVLADVEQFSRGGTHVDDKVLMVLKVSDNGKFSTGSAEKRQKTFESLTPSSSGLVGNGKPEPSGLHKQPDVTPHQR
jgi:hypothetical protein